jgi:hypothetical protein
MLYKHTRVLRMRTDAVLVPVPGADSAGCTTIRIHPPTLELGQNLISLLVFVVYVHLMEEPCRHPGAGAYNEYK